MKKGFTLVEIIVVVTVVALLGTIAVSMYFNTIRNFNYFNNLKNIQSVFRQARSFAITNSSIGDVSPERFGIYFKEDRDNYTIFLFADEGTEYRYEEVIDTIYQSKKYIIPKNKFEITVTVDGRNILFPMAFYFDKTTGNFRAFGGRIDPKEATFPISKSSKNNINIQIKSLENEILNRYLVINQISGLVEEYRSL